MTMRLAAMILLLQGAGAPVWAAVPNIITYQGRLVEGGIPVTGNREIEIRFCDALTAGTCVPTAGTSEQGVSVVGGVFRTTVTVPAGALDTGISYLDISVAMPVGGALTTLSPREQFTSSAYSILASKAASLVLPMSQAAVAGDDIVLTGPQVADILSGGAMRLGTNSAANLAFVTNTVTRLTVDGATGNLGLGVAPSKPLDIARDGQAGAIFRGNGGAVADGGALMLARARGFTGGETLVSAGDRLGELSFLGFDGGAYSSGAFIRAEADQTFAGGTHGSRLLFGTAINGFAIGTERMRLSSSGRLGIGLGGAGGLDPMETIDAQNGAGFATMALTGFSGSGAMKLRRVNGSQAVRGAVAASELLGALEFGGWNGAAYQEQAKISAEATVGWTGLLGGAQLKFFTTPGPGNIQTERMRISDAGFVGINTLAPANFLHVTGNVADPSSAKFDGPGDSAIMIRSTAGTAKQTIINFNSFSVGQAAERNMGNVSFVPGGHFTVATSNDGNTGGIERLRVTADGGVGIGVAAPPGAGARFQVGGHIYAGGTALGAGNLSVNCGTGASIIGTNTAGIITLGSAAVGTDCVLTFSGGGYPSAPSCIVNYETSTTARVGATTTASMTVLFSVVPTTLTKLHYHCIGL